jgi:carbonic anhydrase
MTTPQPFNPDDGDLLAGYHRFRVEIADEAAERARLAAGQQPRTLWIGCSDSRVIPEEITDASPGELFVLRNVANIIPPSGSDDTVGAVIEYAVGHLNVERAIVCGHSGCGGVAALFSSVDAAHDPHLARWVELARPAARQAAELPEGERLAAAVRANVLLQREHLLTYPCVEAAVAAGSLRVYACVYQIGTGEVLVYHSPTGAWQSLPAQLSGRLPAKRPGTGSGG